jgi:hypothetical protein
METKKRKKVSYLIGCLIAGVCMLVLPPGILGALSGVVFGYCIAGYFAPRHKE